jgi:hypothetical protein
LGGESRCCLEVEGVIYLDWTLDVKINFFRGDWVYDGFLIIITLFICLEGEGVTVYLMIDLLMDYVVEKWVYYTLEGLSAAT